MTNADCRGILALVICYCSAEGSCSTIHAIRNAGWRVLITPKHPAIPWGMKFAIDNGAWRAHQTGKPFDGDAFMRLVERYGALADFVVVPDIVASPASLEFSLSWLPRLRHLKLPLLAVQDGMTGRDVAAVLRDHPKLGIFLGGSTEWKLESMYHWGGVTAAASRYLHVARVNSIRRVRLAHEAGAHSIDGSGVTRFPDVNLGRVDTAARQPSLLRP